MALLFTIGAEDVAWMILGEDEEHLNNQLNGFYGATSQ